MAGVISNKVHMILVHYLQYQFDDPVFFILSTLINMPVARISPALSKNLSVMYLS